MNRENSILAGNIKEVSLASRMGMSYNTYKKYKRSSLQLGLFTTVGSSVRAVGLVKALKILSLENIDKHNRFWRGVQYKKMSFNEVYKTIVDGIVLKNFKQQKYKIEKNKEKRIIARKLLSNGKMAAKDLPLVKKIQKEARETGVETNLYVKGMLGKESKNSNNVVITGKFHVGKLTGLSSSSGSNILNRIVKEGKVKSRRIIKRFISNINYSNNGYEVVNDLYSGVVIPSIKYNNYSIIKGSEIDLLP